MSSGIYTGFYSTNQMNQLNSTIDKPSEKAILKYFPKQDLELLYMQPP